MPFRTDLKMNNLLIKQISNIRFDLKKKSMQKSIPTTKFVTAAITAVSLLGLQASAQLPEECFYVTEMHGFSDDPEALLLSDLPMLVAMYKPGQRLASISAIQDEDWNDHLVGLQLRLWSEQDKSLTMSMIGNDDESY